MISPEIENFLIINCLPVVDALTKSAWADPGCGFLGKNEGLDLNSS